MKNKKVLFLMCFICMITVNLHAQQSVHGSGGNATGSGGIISYSVGQIAYTTNSGTTGTVSQGVQQAAEVMLGVEQTEINLQLNIYPNPTTSLLNLTFGEYDVKGVTYSITDINGKQLVQPKMVNPQTTIDVSSLNTAMYLLTISKNEKPVKIYRIIKN